MIGAEHHLGRSGNSDFVIRVFSEILIRSHGD